MRKYQLNDQVFVFSRQNRTDIFAFNLTWDLENNKWKNDGEPLSFSANELYSPIKKSPKLEALQPLMHIFLEKSFDIKDKLYNLLQQKLSLPSHLEYNVNGQRIIFQHQTNRPLFQISDIDAIANAMAFYDLSNIYIVSTLLGRQIVVLSKQNKNYVVQDKVWERMTRNNSFMIPNIASFDDDEEEDIEKKITPEEKIEILSQLPQPPSATLDSTPIISKRPSVDYRQIYNNVLLDVLKKQKLIDNEVIAPTKSSDLLSRTKHPGLRIKGAEGSSYVRPPCTTSSMTMREIIIYEVHFDLHSIDQFLPSQSIYICLTDDYSHQNVNSPPSPLIPSFISDKIDNCLLFNHHLSFNVSNSISLSLRTLSHETIAVASLTLSNEDSLVLSPLIQTSTTSFEKKLIGHVQIFISSPLPSPSISQSTLYHNENEDINAITDSDDEESQPDSFNGLLELNVQELTITHQHLLKQPQHKIICQIMIGSHLFQSSPLIYTSSSSLSFHQEFRLWVDEILSQQILANRLSFSLYLYALSDNESDLPADPQYLHQHLWGSYVIEHSREFWQTMNENYHLITCPLSSPHGQDIGHIVLRGIIRHSSEIQQRESFALSHQTPLRCQCQPNQPVQNIINNLQKQMNRYQNKLSHLHSLLKYQHNYQLEQSPKGKINSINLGFGKDVTEISSSHNSSSFEIF